MEIGTDCDGTLCVMIREYVPRDKTRFIVADSMAHIGDQWKMVQDNLPHNELNPDGVQFQAQLSDEAFTVLAGCIKTQDFLLVNSSHGLRHTMCGLRWTRMLASGRLVCLHDYKPNFPSVMMVTERFLYRHSNYSRVALADGLIILHEETMGSLEIHTRNRIWANINSTVPHLCEGIDRRPQR